MHFLAMCCNEQGQQMVAMDKFLSSMPTKEPNDDMNVVALASMAHEIKLGSL